MITGSRGKAPTSYHAVISRDWDQKDPSTYDPDWVWEGMYTSPVEALKALQEALLKVAHDQPCPHGYLPCVYHLGPRGGMYDVILERTQDHPSLEATVERIRQRH